MHVKDIQTTGLAVRVTHLPPNNTSPRQMEMGCIHAGEGRDAIEPDSSDQVSAKGIKESRYSHLLLQ